VCSSSCRSRPAERPRPNVQVDHRHEAALLMIRSSSSVVKCKPAFGAATLPSCAGVDRLIALLIGFVGPRLMYGGSGTSRTREGRACVEVAHKANTPQPSA